MTSRRGNVRFLAFLVPFSLLALAPSAPAHAATPDRKGCTDPAMFPTRMPGFRIADCKDREFDAFQFRSSKPGAKGPKLEGRYLETYYEVDDRSKAGSPLAVVRNYENAIRQAGGTVVDILPEAFVLGKVVKDGLETWVQVVPYFQTRITVSMIQVRPMEQHVQADAAAFGKGLRESGHASVYGITFDSGKSVVKPDSEPTLAEVAKLLDADPSLRLWVVGHTDSQGDPEQNLTLSRERAAAVVTALTSRHGISPARLKSQGCGMFAPVASNDDDAGRAKNRRVELIRQ